MDFEAFQSNPMAVAAVERKLLITQKPVFAFDRMRQHYALISPGGIFAAWETGCGTNTTELT